jgi:hypothetical protein
MRKIGLSTLTGRVLLLKNDLSFWSMQRTPLSNMTLQGPYLRWAIAIRVTLT